MAEFDGGFRDTWVGTASSRLRLEIAGMLAKTKAKPFSGRRTDRSSPAIDIQSLSRLEIEREKLESCSRVETLKHLLQDLKRSQDYILELQDLADSQCPQTFDRTINLYQQTLLAIGRIIDLDFAVVGQLRQSLRQVDRLEIPRPSMGVPAKNARRSSACFKQFLRRKNEARISYRKLLRVSSSSVDIYQAVADHVTSAANRGSFRIPASLQQVLDATLAKISSLRKLMAEELELLT